MKDKQTLRINKTLEVLLKRYVFITDWKNRNNEIMLYKPKKFKNLYISKKKLYKIRAKQLEYITSTLQPHKIKTSKEFKKDTDIFYELTPYLYIDFNTYIKLENIPNHRLLIIYSLKHKKKYIKKYLKDNKYYIPYDIKYFKSPKHFVKKTSKVLSSIITESNEDRLILSLWSSGSYVYNKDLSIKQLH